MSRQQLGRDNWLHILSSAIANYAAEGGVVQIIGNDDGVSVFLDGVVAGDGRLHADFLQLTTAPAANPAERTGYS